MRVAVNLNVTVYLSMLFRMGRLGAEKSPIYLYRAIT